MRTPTCSTFTSARRRALAMRSTNNGYSMWRSPNHSVLSYFLLAFALSTAFGVGISFAAEYFDSTIRTPDEAHQLLDVPVLAWLPAPDVLRPDTFHPEAPGWYSHEHSRHVS